MSKKKKKKSAGKENRPPKNAVANNVGPNIPADGKKPSTALVAVLLLLLTAAVTVVLGVLEHVKELVLNP